MFFLGYNFSDFHGHSWFFEFPLKTFKTVLCFTFSAILKNCPPGRCATAADSVCSYFAVFINPLNADLNPICHLLALLGVHNILHVSRVRVKQPTMLRFDVISNVILHGTLINYLNVFSFLYCAIVFDIQIIKPTICTNVLF